jgi:Flp pilus assembly protein TadD
VTAAVRVVVVEDSPVQRAHLVDVLQAERDIAVIGQAGEPRAAVDAFRRAVFLEPDRPAAWFQLGLALEGVAGREGARRAYAAALAALERCDPGAVEAELDGWRVDQLAGVLRAKLGRTAGPRP